MGYFFALIPPFLDSVINYLDKFLLSKYNISALVLTVYSGLFAFASGILIVLYLGFYSIDLQVALMLVASGFFVVFLLAAYFKALTLDEASRVGPLFQLVPVFVVILSGIFLHEVLSFKQYLGCVAIIIAGFLFSARRIKNSIKINKAFWYMVLASFMSSMVYILFKGGVDQVGFWRAIPYESLGNGLAAVVLLMTRNGWKQFIHQTRNFSPKVFVLLTVSEFIYRLSRFAFYFALLLIPASIVSVLQGFQPLFMVVGGIILSLWFPHILKEVIDRKTIKVKIMAVVGIFVGLYLLFL
jgi:drug/metabolite transporter (DMT)-like permease